MTALPHEKPLLAGPTVDLAARLGSLVPVITSARLRLRAPTLADFPIWAEIMCSPRAVHMGGPYARDDAFMEFAASVGAWLLRGHGPWLIEDRATGEALGFVLLGFETTDHEPELGFFLREGAEGHGYALEAATVVRDWAWARGLPSLVSYVDPENLRSATLAERLGAHRDPDAEAAYAGTPDEGVAVFRHPRPEIPA